MNRMLEDLQLYIAGLIESGNHSVVFRVIWKLYYRKIVLYCKYQFDINEPEDVAQEICIKAYTKIDIYNSEYPFRSWIYGIARNHCLDYLKKRKYELYESPDTEPDREVTVESELIKKDLNCVIDKVLEKETNDKKEVYFLYYHAELKIREISVLLNLPEGTVKFILFDLRKKLKPVLEDYYEL